MSKQRLIDMFDNMVRKKDQSLVSVYYHPDFVLTTNGKTQEYEAFLQGHERVYRTSIAYEVRYDEATWVEAGDRVAVRCWITITPEGGAPVPIEVMLIAEYHEGQIRRLWELTWPDWSAMKALDSYGD